MAFHIILGYLKASDLKHETLIISKYTHLHVYEITFNVVFLIKFLKKNRNMLTLTADTSKRRQNAPTATIFKPREKYICSKKKYLLIVIFLRLFKNKKILFSSNFIRVSE